MMTIELNFLADILLSLFCPPPSADDMASLAVLSLSKYASVGSVRYQVDVTCNYVGYYYFAPHYK